MSRWFVLPGSFRLKKEVPVTTPRSAALVVLLTAALASGPARAADEPMPGKLILVKPGRLAKFIAKPIAGDTFALPSGASSPTTGGGQLRFFKGNRADTFALPVQSAPLGWKGLGNPAGSKGFKYKGAGTTADPCKVVLIKTKIVKGICRGGGIKLDPPATGDVGVLLTVGSTPMTYLAVFGGDEIRNTADQLKRKDAPAPPACDCGATDPMEFRFANGVGSGICGNVTDGTVTKNFACSEIVVGGGNSPVPATVFPDMVNPLRLKVAECTGKNLILESMSAAETGSNLQCSEPGCLFAPPLAFVLPITPQMGTLRPHWVTYFTVTDVEATAREAVDLGAALCRRVRDVPGVGRFCGIVSPQHVRFSAITYVPMGG